MPKVLTLPDKWNASDMPDLTGKRFLITGATSGIGLSAAKILAATNEWNIIFGCRSIERGQQAISTITKGSENIQLYQLILLHIIYIDILIVSNPIY